MEPKSTLILTKLRPPAARSRAVSRARLLQRLSMAPETDLALVCAPAGYGKTSLLVEWAHELQQDGVALAWYSLDENDNSPLVFGSYLIASLEQALGSGGGLEPVGQVLRASPEVDLLQLLPTVINTIDTAQKPVILVLDDYHLIRTPAIHRVVEFIIHHRPENLHLAIGSRSNPPLPLARLRAKGHLVELRAADLRFTDEETGRFLRDAMHLDLPTRLTNRLAEQVEGWAAGLQLAALSLPGRPDPERLIANFTGGHKRLAEYLLEEVVNLLPEQLQSFLLFTSILERMSAPLCDAILERENSAALLDQLEQENLFLITLDEESTPAAGARWYRYHHLFRDFLQTWLNRTQPERASVLHRAAAGWLAEHGALSEAVYHAFRCEDWSFAADFVEQHSFALIVQSEIATIYEWCAAFPETVLRSRPTLCVFQALALAYRFQGKQRARVEARLQQAEQALAAQPSPEQPVAVEELAAVVQTFLAMIPDPYVDAHRQLDLAQARLNRWPPGDPARFPWLLIAGYAYLALYQPDAAKAVFDQALPLALQSGLYFGMLEVTFHLARLAYSQGQLDSVLEICQKMQEELTAILQSSSLTLPALGCLEVATGCVLLEQNHLEEAEKCLRQGLDRMGWGMNPYYLMTVYLALFRLYEIQGRWAEADACLDTLDRLWPDIQLMTRGFRVQSRLRFQQDDPKAVEMARDWLQRYRSSLGDAFPVSGLGPIGSAEAYYQANLTWARLQIVLNQRQMAQQLQQSPFNLNIQKQYAHENGLYGREIELTLLDAQMFYQQGNEAQALATLEQALIIGRAGGYVRVFDQSAILDSLLHLAIKRGVYPIYGNEILSAIRSTRGREAETIFGAKHARGSVEGKAMHEIVEPLSEREMEVLRMIASGATNQAIAERFVITVGTVKSHIHHIFGKLDARNRTEAVAQARKLGLITQ